MIQVKLLVGITSTNTVDLEKTTNRELNKIQKNNGKIKYIRYHPQNNSISICYDDMKPCQKKE